jgi:hypothetical protein
MIDDLSLACFPQDLSMLLGFILGEMRKVFDFYLPYLPLLLYILHVPLRFCHQTLDISRLHHLVYVIHRPPRPRKIEILLYRSFRCKSHQVLHVKMKSRHSLKSRFCLIGRSHRCSAWLALLSCFVHVCAFTDTCASNVLVAECGRRAIRGSALGMVQ